MNSIDDMHEPPVSKEEQADASQDAREYLHLWRKRAFYSTAAFFLKRVPL